MRISDWSSDVCSSDYFPELFGQKHRKRTNGIEVHPRRIGHANHDFIAAVAFIQQTRLPSAESRRDGVRDLLDGEPVARSEERRVGKGWGRTCRTRGSPYP